jgi:hypothetical protein
VLFDVETRRMAQKRRAAESAGARREQRRRQKGREGCRHAQKGRGERRPELYEITSFFTPTRKSRTYFTTHQKTFSFSQQVKSTKSHPAGSTPGLNPCNHLARHGSGLWRTRTARTGHTFCFH